MTNFCNSSEESSHLAARLKAFYDATADYDAFHAPSGQHALWRHVAEAVRGKRAKSPDRKVRILEAGAGRSGLALFLRETGLREAVSLHAQDVTKANEAWLRTEFDGVTLGDVSEASGTFDIVLSSYVLEHVTAPRAFLDSLWQRVEPSGVMFLVCPRYDFPFYLPRSADHLGAMDRAILALSLVARRLRTKLTGRPAWLVHKDPSVFHLPFYRDRDAVHWVSLFDLRSYWPDIEPLHLHYKGLREAIRIRCLTVAFRRERAAALPR